ncbi:MAG: DUF3105 domain-containing protein [Chloroflexi bacterium]|nr:DUF3105 domain-containing protein [Chloroflexota bacterium]
MSNVTTRRERREQMRRERPHRHSVPPPRRGPVRGPWLPIGVIAAVAAVVFAMYQMDVFAPGAPPVNVSDPKYDVVPTEAVGAQQPDEGNPHVPSGQRVQYGTVPPTSGGHWGQPAGPVAWGIKDIQQPDEAVVHNLEHGGIVIGYKGLNDQETQKLRDLVALLRQNGYPKIILQPYAPLTDARIAVTAWRWLLKLPAFDDVQIVKFVKSHYDGPDAPERGVP